MDSASAVREGNVRLRTDKLTRMLGVKLYDAEGAYQMGWDLPQKAPANPSS